MVKCDICKEKVNENFLGKLFGTQIKIKGKTKHVCSQCQRKLKDKVLDELNK